MNVGKQDLQYQLLEIIILNILVYILPQFSDYFNMCIL